MVERACNENGKNDGKKKCVYFSLWSDEEKGNYWDHAKLR